MNKHTIYGAMLGGGLIGYAAAFMQVLEKMQLLSDSHKHLVCNINSVFSCSTVLQAWQSSVFGFPNSILCLTFFTIFATTGLVGLSGVSLPRGLRLSIQGLALFVLAFALWFLSQSIYVIGALCILCIFCFAGLLLINWGWLRANAKDLPIGVTGRRRLARMIDHNTDTFAWLVLAVLVMLAMLLRFGG